MLPLKLPADDKSSSPTTLESGVGEGKQLTSEERKEEGEYEQQECRSRSDSESVSVPHATRPSGGLPVPSFSASDSSLHSDSTVISQSRSRLLPPPLAPFPGGLPAPIPANEVERVKALLEYHILDTKTEPAFDQLVMLASQICQNTNTHR